jgi:hypothetical protein
MGGASTMRSSEMPTPKKAAPAAATKNNARFVVVDLPNEGGEYVIAKQDVLIANVRVRTAIKDKDNKTVHLEPEYRMVGSKKKRFNPIASKKQFPKWKKHDPPIFSEWQHDEPPKGPVIIPHNVGL